VKKSMLSILITHRRIFGKSGKLSMLVKEYEREYVEIKMVATSVATTS